MPLVPCTPTNTVSFFFFFQADLFFRVFSAQLRRRTPRAIIYQTSNSTCDGRRLCCTVHKIEANYHYVWSGHSYVFISGTITNRLSVVATATYVFISGTIKKRMPVVATATYSYLTLSKPPVCCGRSYLTLSIRLLRPKLSAATNSEL